ncbi:dihydrolipoamide dehydrogenase [Candidatus Marinamargulisbacteria bacterium SCGC AG-343-D04]|nr:dihydrolipoamide dehydrogenase [Candidatus Marinamargulisbacteria bacterium SCGC AG-343-D04]
MTHFDIIIIGSGGGSKITRPAASLGLKVAIIEKDSLGGTCLNRGCIPSKMLIHPADIIQEIKEASKFDIHIDKTIKVDSKKLVKRVSKTVQEESSSIEPLYEKNPNITYFKGCAEFTENKVIRINNQRISADTIVIAAGARPYIPNIEGIESTPYWTSTEALKSTEIPKRLVVIGGGYIACELGYYFQSMGSKVTFLVRSECLRPEDDDIKEEFHKTFSKSHTIIKDASPTKINYIQNKFIISYSCKNTVHEIEAEQCLMATGITPNTDTLKCENTDISLSKSGYINVNNTLETNIKGIYAFGDIIGRYFFRHSANFEGDYVFNRHIKKSISKNIEYPPMPHAVFTNPQVAGVGKREKECIAENIDYYCGINAYKDSAMGMALLSDHGFVKLIFQKNNDRLIGAHIIGKEASNMIHMLIVAINLKATRQDLFNMIYVHPALPEIVRNAVRNAKKDK